MNANFNEFRFFVTNFTKNDARAISVLALVIAKSIFAPNPGPVGACSMPFASGRNSSSSP